MAGSYPDVPGRRFAYHLDGTFMFRRAANMSLVDLNSTMASLNSHAGTNAFTASNEGSTVGGRYVCLVFPELRNIDGYNMYSVSNTGYYDFQMLSIEVSSDTVDGVGGTWSQVSTNWSNDGSMSPGWRENITLLSATNVKAIRFNYNWTTGAGSREWAWRALHIYGSVVAGQNPDRLMAWDSSADIEVDGSYFDFGDVAQGTQQTKQFRLKNGSASSNAIGVTLSQDDVPGGGMSLEFSTDGTNFTSPLTIGDINAGVTSGVLHVRRAVGASEPVQLRASVIKAVASSWS